MRQIYLLMIMLMSAFYGSAQKRLMMTVDKEGKILVLPQQNRYELNIPQSSYKSYTPSQGNSFEIAMREFHVDVPTTSVAERPMDMQTQSGAYRPFYDAYAPMLRRVSPMAFDFKESVIMPLNEHLAFVTTGAKYTWPGLGGLTTISPYMVWQNGQLTVVGGGFAGRFATPFNPHPGYVGGANAQVRYDMTDRLAVKAWGQYAYYGNDKNNPHMMLNPFYHHTGVGGAFEVKFNDDFGVGVGVNYEYNHFRRKMEPQYLIYPVINSSKIKIGIR